jgi:hypothetical protein
MNKILLSLLFLISAGTFAQSIDENDTVIFDLSGASCTGNFFQVPVSFKSDDTIYALDFSMKYDESKITFNAIVSQLPSVNASAYYNPVDSTLRMTSFSMSEMPHDTPVVSLYFNMLAYPVTESDFNNIITYLNGDVCSYKVIPPSSPAAITAGGGSLVIAPGDSIMLSATSGNGFTFLWSTNDTTQTIYVTEAGIYAVTVTTAGGCISTDSVTIIMSAPLPIELISFSASQKENHIEIDWTTATEINNDFFEVQRAGEEISWQSLARTDGSGNTSSPHFYSVADEIPIQGNNYYRLKQVDFDGTSTYSEMVVVPFIKQEADGTSIKIFPNPCNGHLNVLSATNVTMRLFDMNGREVLPPQYLHAHHDQTIDVHQLADGLYSACVYSDSPGASENNSLVWIHH